MAVPVKLEHRDSMLRAFEGSKEKSGFSAVARAEEHASHMKLLENALKVSARLSLLMPSHAYAARAGAGAEPALCCRVPQGARNQLAEQSRLLGDTQQRVRACCLAASTTHSGTPWEERLPSPGPPTLLRASRPSSLPSHASRYARVHRRQRAACPGSPVEVGRVREVGWRGGLDGRVGGAGAQFTFEAP